MIKPVIVIPARRESTRFPNKPMALINRKPLIYWTWRQACKAGYTVWVATDCPDIKAAVEAFGGRAILTPAECRNGTERCAVAARALDLDVVINWQGDAPMIPFNWPRFMVRRLQSEPVELVTAGYWGQGHAGSVQVFNHGGLAVDFERAHGKRMQMLHHVGIYVYTRAALDWYIMQDPVDREINLGLEQMRWPARKIGLSIFQHPLHEMRECNYPEDVEPLERALGVRHASIWAVT